MKYLLVVTDVFTSYTVLRALPNKEAATVAAALFGIIGDFGPPRAIQSDNEFYNSTMTAFLDKYGILHRTIPAYNPRSAGLVEKHGHTASLTLKKMCRHDPSSWSEVLPLAQLAMNDKVRHATNAAPFALLFNRALNEFQSYTNFKVEDITITDRKLWTEREQRLKELIFPAIAARADIVRQKANAEFMSSRTTVRTLPVGCIVYLRDPRLPRNKNTPAWDGPYTVADVLPNRLYRLRDSVGGLYHRDVTRDMIKVKRTSDIVIPPPISTSSASVDPARADGVISVPSAADPNEPAFYVDCLLDHRKVKTGDGGFKIQYLCKWRDFSVPDWIEEHNVEDLTLIRDYYLRRSEGRLPKDQAGAATKKSRRKLLPLRAPSLKLQTSSSSSSSSSFSSSSAATTSSALESVRPADLDRPRPRPERRMLSANGAALGSIISAYTPNALGPLARRDQRLARGSPQPPANVRNLTPQFARTYLSADNEASAAQRDFSDKVSNAASNSTAARLRSADQRSRNLLPLDFSHLPASSLTEQSSAAPAAALATSASSSSASASGRPRRSTRRDVNYSEFYQRLSLPL